MFSIEKIASNVMYIKYAAKLTARKRNRLPDSAFAIPEKRKYPIHDEAHARAALAFVAKYGSPEEKHRVRAAVCRRWGMGCKEQSKAKAASMLFNIYPWM